MYMYISIPLGKSRLSDENSIGLETISDIHADVTIEDCFFWKKAEKQSNIH